MWKLKNQITIRWVVFTIALLTVVSSAVYLNHHAPETLNQSHAKLSWSRLVARFESLEALYYPLIYIGTTISFFVGIPAAVPYLVILPLLGSIPSMIVLVLSQYSATLLMVRFFRGRKPEESMEPELKKALGESRVSSVELGFWARIFIAMPLRTIDLMLLHCLTVEKDSRFNYIAVFAGTSIRCILTASWINSLIPLVISFRPFPELDVSIFLIFSSAMIVSGILPRAPELSLAPESLKSFFFKVYANDTVEA